MTTITVFETYQDLGTKLGELYQLNKGVLTELGQRRNQAETEFRARYDVDKRIQAVLEKDRERERERHPDWGENSLSTLLLSSPGLVDLSTDEKQQFNREYSDYGKGLELSITIGLLGIGSQYLVQAGGVVRPDEARQVGKNHRSIKGLAKATRDYVHDAEQEEHYPLHGATVISLHYTVTEVLPLVTEENRTVLRQNLKEDSQPKEKEGKKAREMRLATVGLLEALIKEKRNFRGLDERERDNFLKEYSKY